MIDSILISKGVENKASREKIKLVLAVFTIALAVVSPFVAHVAFGSLSGVRWLPMYYPVLLSGLLLGSIYGSVVGAVSPIISFILTSIVGTPMPTLARLPFMVVELAIFGAVSGAFSHLVYKKSYMAFPVVLLTEVVGRGVFLVLVAIFNSVTTFTPSVIWTQIKMGWPGLLSTFIIVPCVVMLVSFLSRKSER